jgi:glc operon protein GlcG
MRQRRAQPFFDHVSANDRLLTPANAGVRSFLGEIRYSVDSFSAEMERTWRKRLPPSAFAAYCFGPGRIVSKGAGENKMQWKLVRCVLAAFVVMAGPASAQQPATPPYGLAITLDDAKRAMAAAELEATKNSWQVAITILDSGGNLVMFHKGDNAQLAAISASEGKARTALTFKRPSKALDDAIAAGGAGLRLLSVKDITPLEGGLPIVVDGKIVGAIGVSGALSSQDSQVAKVGADALAK